MFISYYLFARFSFFSQKTINFSLSMPIDVMRLGGNCEDDSENKMGIMNL